MTDEQRLDWLQRSMRLNIGGNTPERWVACNVHCGDSVRDAIDAAAKRWPDGVIPEQEVRHGLK